MYWRQVYWSAAFGSVLLSIQVCLSLNSIDCMIQSFVQVLYYTKYCIVQVLIHFWLISILFIDLYILIITSDEAVKSLYQTYGIIVRVHTAHSTKISALKFQCEWNECQIDLRSHDACTQESRMGGTNNRPATKGSRFYNRIIQHIQVVLWSHIDTI